jgi:protein subunit release factor B
LQLTSGIDKKGKLSECFLSMDPIQDLLEANGLNSQDFEEKISRSSGPGGQHVNKVSTAVRLRHLPTDLTAVGRESRSLHCNRLLAYKALIERIRTFRKQTLQQQRALLSKRRRQAARRSFKTKENMRQAKRIRAEIKRSRDKIVF